LTARDHRLRDALERSQLPVVNREIDGKPHHVICHALLLRQFILQGW
jgi:hypothetical protein